MNHQQPHGKQHTNTIHIWINCNNPLSLPQNFGHFGIAIHWDVKQLSAKRRSRKYKSPQNFTAPSKNGPTALGMISAHGEIGGHYQVEIEAA